MKIIVKVMVLSNNPTIAMKNMLTSRDIYLKAE